MLISKKIRDFNLLCDYDDIFQECLVILNKCILMYNDQNSTFYTYLSRCINNKLSSERKRILRNKTIFFDYDYFCDDSINIEESYDNDNYNFIVDELTDFQKLIFRLRYIENMTIEDIIKNYGASKSTICYNIRKIKEKIIKKMEEMGYTI